MLKQVASFLGKRHNIGKLITIVRGVTTYSYVLNRARVGQGRTLIRQCLHNITMSTATVLGMIFAVLLLIT